jgi:hypothetical protein
MRILIIFLIFISACNLKLPTYKLADQTSNLKYQKLIPTHSLPSSQSQRGNGIATIKNKPIKTKITSLECKSFLLKNKNKYTSKQLKELLKECTKE